MRNILALVSIIAMACCPPKSAWYVKNPGSLVEHIEKSTVALYWPVAQKTYCTGVWVSDLEILTAAHCVHALVEASLPDDTQLNPDDRAVWSKVPFHYIVSAELGQQAEPAAVRLANASKVDFDVDLALLVVEAPGPAHDAANVPDTSPEVGAALHFMGNPSGRVYSYTRGYVSAYRKAEKGNYMQVSAPLWFGNSGGGAFDDGGDLVGIAVALAWHDAQNAAMCVSLGDIREFLRP